MKPLRVVFLTADDRDERRRYDLPAPYFGSAAQALLAGFAELPDVEIHVISCVHQPIYTPRQLGPRLFFDTVVVGPWGWRLGFAGCVLALRRKILALTPDLVHGNGSERFAALGAAFSGRPNVITLLGNMRSVARKMGARFGSYHWLVARLETLALRRTIGVIANSNYTRNQVCTRTPHTWVVPNALLPIFFSPLPPPRAANAVPRLLCIGSILPYKRSVELLDAAARWHANGLSFSLEFLGGVGANEYGCLFREKLNVAEKAGYARGHGLLDSDAVLRELDSADAVIHLSVEESFGLAPAEGLARNLKLFATHACGVIDITNGVEAAETFAPNDWPALDHAVAAWLAAGAPRPKTAADTMRSRYHPSAVAAAHLEIYREISHTV
jgi:glycosyltransferase involved in cell wall biosynthesis